jgi:hypothetical protein
MPKVRAKLGLHSEQANIVTFGVYAVSLSKHPVRPNMFHDKHLLKRYSLKKYDFGFATSDAKTVH